MKGTGAGKIKTSEQVAEKSTEICAVVAGNLSGLRNKFLQPWMAETERWGNACKKIFDMV